ncbi:MAG: hypothetical protein PF505_13710 [Vallitaleaceae bacterium]|jgi:hypothetical protein|nr:hypothetical protein [Vallitaleaceae bacterium]
MAYKTRLAFILKYSKIHIFAFISIFYGLVFGGIFSLGEMADGNVPIAKFLFNSLLTGGLYFCLFSVAIVAIYIGKNTKAFISLSMSRKVIIKMWYEIVIYMATINTIIITILALVGPHYTSNMPRLLNMDFLNLTAKDILVLIVLVWISNQLLIQIISLVTNIGNRYNMVVASTSLFLSLAFIVFAIKPMLDLIIWGELLIPVMLIITILTMLLIAVNKYLLKRVEVTR